jgi:hypothetical protein
MVVVPKPDRDQVACRDGLWLARKVPRGRCAARVQLSRRERFVLPSCMSP